MTPFQQELKDAFKAVPHYKSFFGPMQDYGTLTEACRELAKYQTIQNGNGDVTEAAAIAFLYAYHIIQRRDDECEALIAESPSHAFWYAQKFIGERFEIGELAMSEAEDQKWWNQYHDTFIKEAAPGLAKRMKADSFIETGIATTTNLNEPIIMRF